MKCVGVCMCLLLLAGCASQSLSPKQFSGFLSQQHYSKLGRIAVPSDQTAYRYISPDFVPANYSSVMVEPVIAFPKPEPTSQVSIQTLLTLQSKLTRLLEDSMSQVLPLARSANPGVIRLQTAITGVNVSTKGLAIYEYIPIALIAASVNTAAGGRDQQVRLFIEMQAVDAVSNEVLAVGVREISGDDLENVKSKLEAQQLNKGLKAAGTDMVAAMQELFGS